MLMVSAGKLVFEAKKKKKEALKGAKNEAMKVENRANGGMAEACLTF